MIDVKLIKGDFIDVGGQIPSQSVDVIITDLPYGKTQNPWDEIIPFVPMWKEIERVIKPKGAIVLFGTEPFSSALRMSNLYNYKYDFIWDKILKTGHLNAKIMPMSQHEIISVFGYGKINYYPIMEYGVPEHSSGKRKSVGSSNYGKQSGDYIGKTGNTKKYPSSLSLLKFQKVHPSKCLHPTQKPVPLIKYLIETFSVKGDTVLDFAMGSGSTGIACIETQRNFIGVEKYADIFKIAKNRLKSKS